MSRYRHVRHPTVTLEREPIMIWRWCSVQSNASRPATVACPQRHPKPRVAAHVSDRAPRPRSGWATIWPCLRATPPATSGDRDVLNSLPRTRPARRSAKRAPPPRRRRPRRRPRPRPTRRRAPARARRRGRHAGGHARPTARRAPAAEAQVRRERRARPRRRGEAQARAAQGAPKPRSAGAPRRRGRRPLARIGARPTPASAPRAAEPAAPPAGDATASEASAAAAGPTRSRSSGTAVQAAGEIAQIGATLWTQAAALGDLAPAAPLSGAPTALRRAFAPRAGVG